MQHVGKRMLSENKIYEFVKLRGASTANAPPTLSRKIFLCASLTPLI